MIAVLLAALLWSSPAPTLWVCNPGKSPTSSPSNCEHVRTIIVGEFKLASILSRFHLVPAPPWLP